MTTIGQLHIDPQTYPVTLTGASVWNAVAPVSRLPPEILAYTFVYCARGYYHENLDDAGVPQWVNVSYVCSRWRHVALNCPTLWSYLFVVSPRWTEVSLIRSKEVPLRVRVYFSLLDRKTALDFMEQVAPHAERFRECCLHLQSNNAELVLRMLSARSAPRRLHLPRLAYLSIAAPFSTLVRFLSCIVIPATTQVRLGCHLEAHPNTDHYAPFCAFLSQRFSNSENEATSVPPIRTMVMDNSPRRMSIAFIASGRKCDHRRHNSPLFEDCDCDIPLKVEMNWQPHTEDWEDLVVDICRSVPLARLRNLILDRCRLPSALWFDIFWHLDALRYIELIGGAFSDLLIPLSLSLSSRPLPENADGPTNQCTSQLFAPSLEELYLNGVRVPRNYRCRGNPSMHGSHTRLFCEALVRRRVAGHALKLLMINGSFPFSQKEVMRLGTVVSRVEVNRFATLLPDNENCEDCKEEASEE